jgi:O-antigen biosynthesis protein WbqP
MPGVSHFLTSHVWNSRLNLEKNLEAMMPFTKRIFDLTVAVMGLALLLVPMALIALAVKITSNGPVFYWSKRIGRHNVVFQMPKFRTMLMDTPEVATHLLEQPQHYLTPIGSFLRKTSLDELPQLLSIISGNMSFIGPRPALYNQEDLIRLRTEKGVHRLTPGLTGWAQINGRDELSIPEKVGYDEYYLQHRSAELESKIFILTFLKVIRSDGVTH